MNENSMKEVDRKLRDGVRRPLAPTSLHADIMRRLRSNLRQAPEAEVERPSPLHPWSWIAALGGTVALALILAIPSPKDEPLPSASATLDLGHELARAVPEAFVAPLSTEWSHLNNDARRAADFLLASIP